MSERLSRVVDNKETRRKGGTTHLRAGLTPAKQSEWPVETPARESRCVTGPNAGDILTRTTGALTPLVQSAAGRARELSDGFAAEVKKAAALTMDAYQQAIKRQLDLSIGLADAVKVDWVSELTRRNALVIGELVAVYASATQDLLK